MQIKPGSLLISPPSMLDERFSRTVLLLTQYNSTGSFALCLNRPTRHSINPYLKEIGINKELPFNIYWGGPVNPGSIWMIHSNEWGTEHTMTVNKDWKLTSNEAMFHHIADGDAPRQFKILSGFCSWGPAQLEMEMHGVPPFTKSSSWLIAHDPEPEWIFEKDDNNLWDDSIQLAGQKAVDAWF